MYNIRHVCNNAHRGHVVVVSQGTCGCCVQPTSDVVVCITVCAQVQTALD